jgi:uncharacterized damage-inducible protein DinB
MTVESLFLEESAKTLGQLTSRIEACLGRLTEDQIWARGSDNENAVGNLALHLAGNVRQWIIASLGGAADLRKRDEEFAARGGRTAQELVSRLKATVDEAAGIIASLDTARLTREYAIQKYRVSGVAAVYHVVDHFAQHTGQIIFATKMLTGEDLGFYSHLKTVAPATSAQ